MTEEINNVALVLEGGGFRGIYTAGVLDVLMSNRLFFNYLIGVSAGAAYGVSYVSRQFERNLKVNNYINDPRYCGWRHLFRDGNYFNWNFVYHHMPTSIVPFDYQEYHQSTSSLNVVVTNIETGKPEYRELRTDRPEVFRDWLTATSALPFISKPQPIDGKLYMDGGLSDSIPYRKALADGNKRAVVVLTRPKEYRKKPMKKSFLMKWFYRQYPKLIDCMMERAYDYNRSLDELDQLERDGIVFIIRPTSAISVSRLENSPQKLRMVYDLSVQQMDSILPQLKNWLKQQ
jgi:predicted patatin/cPLA2 family phospholipase